MRAGSDDVMLLMESSNGTGGREAQRAVGERSEAGAGRAEPVGAPEPELVERPTRRQFSAQYKLRVVREADACTRPGEIGAVLRREGLYSLLLTEWRRTRDAGALEALARPRGRRPAHSLEAENTELRRRAERAEADLGKAKRVIEVLAPLKRIFLYLLTESPQRLEGPGLDRMLLGIRVGDPDDEVLGARLAKESVRDVYLSEDPEDATLLLDKAIEGCAMDSVDEIDSLGRIISRWRAEILAHHTTGASNGPTEGLNLLVKKVKRAGHGFRSFANYRLRILLHAGGVNWPAQRPPAPTIRTRSPR